MYWYFSKVEVRFRSALELTRSQRRGTQNHAFYNIGTMGCVRSGLCIMAAFVPSLSSLPTGRHHATPSLPCSHRQQLPVATVPRRCQPVMLQAGSAEQQQAGPAEQRRAFDQRMNRMCNEVVRWCPPCLCIFCFVCRASRVRCEDTFSLQPAMLTQELHVFLFFLLPLCHALAMLLA